VLPALGERCLHALAMNHAVGTREGIWAKTTSGGRPGWGRVATLASGGSAAVASCYYVLS
jgi:hypothetical protein